MNPFIEFTKWLIKWALLICTGLIALGLVLAVGAWGWHWWNYDRHIANVTVGIENEDSETSLANIIERKAGNGRSCSVEHPIFVVVVNKSSRTINRVSIAISANLPDYSTDILEYGSNVSTDRIIKASDSYATCWRFKVKSGYEKEPGLKNAQYKARLTYVEFAND